MKTKFFIIGALCAAMALVGCNKQPLGGENPAAPVGYTNIILSIGDCSATKALTSDDNEKTLQNIQIFVFKGGTGADAGLLEETSKAGFDTPLNVSTGSYTASAIRCTAGEKIIYVICNDAIDRTAASVGIRTKDQLLNQTSELKDNAPNKLLMVGNITKTFAEGDQTCTVDVKRMCAAIVLQSIKNAFVSPAYQVANSFRVVEMYLLNVPAYQNFNMEAQLNPGTQEADHWYSKLAAETGSLRSSLIYDSATDSPKVVNYNESYTSVHTFYSYPNSCAFSEDASWGSAGRATLLVVKGQVNTGADWIDSYYTVALDKNLKSNYKYLVNLTVNRPGSNDPNHPVKFSDVTPTVTVLPWDSGDPYNPEI